MPEDQKKSCFVIMGFGTKTDLATGRKLNLDKSYQGLIKPVIENKGLVCVRADELRHSGAIDVPMYQQLLTADVVVADISTANPNAFYELGLRHALRPRTTIVISEEQLCYPFDLNHILINKYTHLGENIDYFEVLRFQKLLGETLDAVLKSEQPDSPVYTFLDGLIPPSLQRQAEQMAEKVSNAIKDNTSEPLDIESQTLSLIVKQAEEALKARSFPLSKSLFQTALQISMCNATQQLSSSNSYLIHRLAYATYKAQQPDAISALKAAIDLLADLDVRHTNDSETVRLAGQIEKRLYFHGLGEKHLANAIQYYERSYFLLHNRYHGVNLAFLINNRVDTDLFKTNQDKIADMVLANRIRREVLEMCENDWNKLESSEGGAKNKIMKKDDELAIRQRELEDEMRFWILVNKAEAHYALGEMSQYREARKKAEASKHEEVQMKSFTEQIKKLKPLLKKYSALLGTEWNDEENNFETQPREEHLV